MKLRNLTLVAVLLVGLALRLYHLDYRALWWDEGLSLFFARLDYFANARFAVTLADTNPPIYRLLLGVWINVVGSSAWTARLFSTFQSVLLIAIIYRIARDLKFNNTVSLIAASLGAASPMLIYYGQEAKGYSLVALAGAASVLVWLRLHRSAPQPTPLVERLWLWALWAVSLSLALGSHYIAAFLVLTENLWTFVLTLRQWRGNERRWVTHWAWMLGAQVVVALAMLPFVILTFKGTTASVQGQTGSFDNLNTPALFTRLILELTQGPTADGLGAWLIALIVIALVVVGFIGLSTRNRWLLFSWLVLPLGLGLALNAYHEFFFPRFVLYTLPALLILIANGMLTLAERLKRLAPSPTTQTALIAGLVILWSPTLLSHYNTPTDAGEDWRPVAEAVRPLMRSGDAAIYVWGWIPGYLDAYLPPAPSPIYSLGFFTPQGLDSDMQAITANRQRLWLFDYQVDQFDVRNLGGVWLGKRAALVYNDWPGQGFGHAALFALTPTLTQSTESVSGEFANGLKFETPAIKATLSPGDALALSINWTVTRPLPERYTIFLHGLATDGSLAFGRDSEPDNGLTPITDWQPGQAHTELRGVLIPPETPPGQYTITLGIYKTATGEVDPAGPITVGTILVK
jgi:mannosyltransferase